MEERFLDELECVPWFLNVGKRIQGTARVKQRSDWNDWPGPEDDSVMELTSRLQALRESIINDAKDKRASIKRLWDKVHEVVHRVGSEKVAYDPKKRYLPPSQCGSLASSVDSGGSRRVSFPRKTCS